MATKAAEIVIGSDELEWTHVRAVVRRAVHSQTPLFLGRFVSDMPFGLCALSTSSEADVTVRQFGASCYVNAKPQVAEVCRAEIGLEAAEHALQSGRYAVILLSQILTAVGEDLLMIGDIHSLIDACPQNTRLILTGCEAPPTLAARCVPCRAGM